MSTASAPRAAAPAVSSGGGGAAGGKASAAAAAAGASRGGRGGKGGAERSFGQASEKSKDVRAANIAAARGVADAIRTSLGPRGMDKMVQGQRSDVLITNDGATILSKMQVQHPAAKMLVNLAKAQDVEAGDGTTTVVIICGALLSACQSLLGKGIHPTTISEAFQLAADRAGSILRDSMAMPLDLNDRAALLRAASTSLSSKVVAQYSNVLAPIAVDAVLRVADLSAAAPTPAASAVAAALTAPASSAGNGRPDGGPATADGGGTNGGDDQSADAVASAGGPAPARGHSGAVDLRNVRVIKKLGGTLEETHMLSGLVLTQRAAKSAGGPTRIANARVGLIQFCLSSPKTDIENNVVVRDYASMDRVLREERQYTLQMCKKIKAAGCNVLLIQKSILRDATNELSLHFLAKMKIMVVQEIERDEVEFISKTLGCVPIAGLDSFTPAKLAKVDTVEEVPVGSGSDKVVRFSPAASAGAGHSTPAATANGGAADGGGGDGGSGAGSGGGAGAAGAARASASAPNGATAAAGAAAASPSPSGAAASNTGAPTSAPRATAAAPSGAGALLRKRDTVSVLVRGSNQLMLDEAERSLHDALCVTRSLVKRRSMLPGGAAVETELSVRLGEYAKGFAGVESYCIKAFAEALETVPYTLAENAGLNPIDVITELRQRHARGERNAGISAKKSGGAVVDMVADNVVQPTLVSESALALATEAVRLILKIDDIVMTTR